MSVVLMICLCLALLGGVAHGIYQICGGYSGPDYTSNNLFSFLFTDKHQ